LKKKTLEKVKNNFCDFFLSESLCRRIRRLTPHSHKQRNGAGLPSKAKNAQVGQELSKKALSRCFTI
jgi:hypothetical protein